VPSGAQPAPTQIGLVTLHENAGGKTVENAGDSSGGTISQKLNTKIKTGKLSSAVSHDILDFSARVLDILSHPDPRPLS